MNVAGAGLCAHRTRSRLFKGDVARSSTRVKTAGNASCIGVATARFCIRATLDVADVQVARAGVGAHLRSDVADGYVPGAGVRAHRTSNVANALIARSGVRLNRGVLGNGDIVADGDVIAQSFILNASNTDAVSVLLNGGILLDALDLFFCRDTATVKP